MGRTREEVDALQAEYSKSKLETEKYKRMKLEELRLFLNRRPLA
jgi:hypothetical protein